MHLKCDLDRNSVLDISKAILVAIHNFHENLMVFPIYNSLLILNLYKNL